MINAYDFINVFATPYTHQFQMDRNVHRIITPGYDGIIRKNHGEHTNVKFAKLPKVQTTRLEERTFGKVVARVEVPCEPYFNIDKFVARYNRTGAVAEQYPEVSYPARQAQYGIIVDHIGSVEFSTDKEENDRYMEILYKWLTAKYGKYTTVTKLAKEEYAIFNDARHKQDEEWLCIPWERASEKMKTNAKNGVRHNYRANKVVIIVPFYDESEKAHWWANIWSQHAKDVTFLGVKKCNTGKRKIDFVEYEPDVVQAERLDFVEDSKLRNFISDYAPAFDINFDAPVYRDLINEATGSVDNWFNRHDRWKVRDTYHEDDKAKPITSAEKYRASKNIARDEDLAVALNQINGYAQLGVHIAEFLAEGYQLCPCCRKPMRVEKMEYDLSAQNVAIFNNMVYPDISDAFIAKHPEVIRVDYNSDMFKDSLGEKSGRHCKCGFYIPADLLQSEPDAYYDDTNGKEDNFNFCKDDEYDILTEALDTVESLLDNPDNEIEDEIESETINF